MWRGECNYQFYIFHCPFERQRGEKRPHPWGAALRLFVIALSGDGASGSAGASAAAATAAGMILGIGLLGPAGVILGGLGGSLVGQAADADQTIGLLGQADADQELAVLGAGGQIHVAVAGLCTPPGCEE